MRAALTDDDACNRCTAAATGFPLAAVDSERVLELPLAAIGMNVIIDRGTPAQDGAVQNATDTLREGLPLLFGEAERWPEG